MKKINCIKLGFIIVSFFMGLHNLNAATFEQRCADQGVVFCYGFDDLADMETGFYAAGDPARCSDGVCKTIDTNVKASGLGSMRMEIPSNTGANTSGGWKRNFSEDLSVQFGEGEEFYVQWRQRFSRTMIDTLYTNTVGQGGWKTVIIGEGDRSGYNASSCTKLEVVLNNYAYRGAPQGYWGCGIGGGFQSTYGAYDFKLQNMYDAGVDADPRYCLYSTSKNTTQRPLPGCFPFYADEWMTFQVRIKVGNWSVGNSEVDVWAGREGIPSIHLMSKTDLNIRKESEGSMYGKIWFLPYNTKKDSAQVHPVAYTWYDDLLVSKTKILDPTDEVTNVDLPTKPTGLTLAK